MQTYVPLPVFIGWCLECQEDVPIDIRGRCQCGSLCTWRSDQHRPPIVTETLLKLQDAARIEPGSLKGRRRPLNARASAGGEPLTMFGAHWYEINDGDPRGRTIFLRHYSATTAARRKRDARGNEARFAGPGEKMILLTVDCSALFIWRRERFRLDDQVGVNCAAFRNEGGGAQLRADPRGLRPGVAPLAGRAAVHVRRRRRRAVDESRLVLHPSRLGAPEAALEGPRAPDPGDAARSAGAGLVTAAGSYAIKATQPALLRTQPNTAGDTTSEREARNVGRGKARQAAQEDQLCPGPDRRPARSTCRRDADAGLRAVPHPNSVPADRMAVERADRALTPSTAEDSETPHRC